MKQIYDDLWQTSAEHPLAQVPNSKCHAYLLRRDESNLLFYITGREAVAQVSIESGNTSRQTTNNEKNS
jgi:hypothetical protein